MLGQYELYMSWMWVRFFCGVFVNEATRAPLTAYFDRLCDSVFRFRRLSPLIRTLKACPQKPEGLRTMKVQCFTAYPSVPLTGCFEPTGLRHDTLQRPP